MEKVVLKKQITLFQAVNICIGHMIGSGIFVSPYGVLKHVKSPGLSLIVWAICGVFNLIGALCYAELGTSFARSGGEYTYIYIGFGRIAAFICLWLVVVMIMPVGTAIGSLLFAINLLQPFYPSCSPPDVAVKLVATLVIREYS